MKKQPDAIKVEMQSILADEDPKNPLTDEQLAEKLGIRRERVVALRREAGIASCRMRRSAAILCDARRILHAEPQLSERGFSAALQACGYAISRYAAASIRREVAKTEPLPPAAPHAQEPPSPALSPTPRREEAEAFRTMIGQEKGLHVQINQAKAAILYPPNGLHTLLTGPSGVGKSYLATCMYAFAKEQGVIGADAKFVVFNCADYADNPQLLLSQLFGYRRGAFSGAAADKAGLVESADRGILFLDEVHRLPSEGQEILFSILDKGEFRRLGDTRSIRVNVRIIAATTENIESALLLTFRRRIPMMIDLPALSERPASERYAMIRRFFLAEAAQTQRVIRVDEKVLRYLLLYPCPGNIGQLLSDIRVACANAFLRSVAKGRTEVSVRVRNLARYEEPARITKKQEEEIAAYIRQPLILDEAVQGDLPTVSGQLDTIYHTIEDDVLELRRIGLDSAKINELLQRKIKEKLKDYVLPRETVRETMEDLCAVMDARMVSAVREAVEKARLYLPELQQKLCYFLAIHLSTFADRVRRGVYWKLTLDVHDISTRYQREYEVACILARDLGEKLELELPPEEIGMLAMYLYTFSHADVQEEPQVRVLVLSHGRVASAMAEVANRLLNMNEAIGIDMDFSESQDVMLEKVIQVVEEVDAGKGCLLLVDIGSLTTLAERITERTGIRTACVERVDTAMVLEAVRRAALTTVDLDEIAAALRLDKFGAQDGVAGDRLPALLFVCISGEGTARRLLEYIRQRSEGRLLQGVHTFTVGTLDAAHMKAEIAKIRSSHRILASIGNMKPLGTRAPFISAQEIFSGDGIARLHQILVEEADGPASLADVLEERSIVCRLKLSDKTQIIDHLVGLLQQQGAVEAEFLLSAYKRESIGATYLSGGIGIPHGSAEFVRRPAIAVASLERSVLWEHNFMVDLVFLLALRETDQKYIDAFYHIAMDKQELQSLKEAASPCDMYEILTKKQN